MKDFLKKLRKNRGLTQEGLAGVVGWSVDKIGRIERNDQDLSIDDIIELGKAFRMSQQETAGILLQMAGISNVDISDFMPEAREDKIFEIEAHVGSICVNKTKDGVRVLIGKRLLTRDLYAGQWECGGGQVLPGENFTDAILRQVREEFGIEVRIIGVIGTYEIQTLQINKRKIPGVSFLCELVNSDAADKIKINPKEYSEHRWIKEEKLDVFDIVDGVKKDILKVLKFYKRKIKKN
jgi:transcriptional regulator with XRE-family HTH domain